MIKSPVSTALFALALLPGTAAAQPTPISTCNYDITEPGSYVLVEDLTCDDDVSSSYGVYITADDVELRMNGHTIRLAEGQLFGIAVQQKSRVEIQGPGAVVGPADYGLQLYETYASRVTGITVTGSQTGIRMVLGSDNVLINNTIRENLAGVALAGSLNNILRANQVIANGEYGILLFSVGSPDWRQYPSGNIFQANVARDSARDDIFEEGNGSAEFLNTWVKNFFGTTNSPCVQ